MTTPSPKHAEVLCCVGVRGQGAVPSHSQGSVSASQCTPLTCIPLFPASHMSHHSPVSREVGGCLATSSGGEHKPIKLPRWMVMLSGACAHAEVACEARCVLFLRSAHPQTCLADGADKRNGQPSEELCGNWQGNVY
jgi:hypothetical protein